MQPSLPVPPYPRLLPFTRIRISPVSLAGASGATLPNDTPLWA
jgi:hypothetical protein